MSKSSSKAGKSGDEKDGHDLTTILDEDQREELTFLIANITESMRKLIIENFDATAGLDKSLLKEDMTEDEKLMSADASADVSKLDEERKKREANEKDLATSQMQNLKRNSLRAFDNWREDVNQRMGEAVNKKPAKRGKDAKSATPSAPNTIGRITEAPVKTSNLKFRDLFWPTKTPLTKLPMDKRTLILHSVLLLLLSLEHYTAPSRVLLLNLTSSLKLPLKTFEQDEYTTAKGLLEAAREMTADEELKKKAEENKDARKWRVGLATAAGAAILGISGGLAAPLVAAGVGSVMGGLGLGATAAAGYLGSVAGSTILVGSLFGAYGGRMTGQMMDNYAREVEDFEFLPVHNQNKTSEDQEQGPKEASDHDHKLRVTICISGWLTEKEEVVKPWRVIGTGAEVFALKYELEALLKLGNAMDGMVKSAAWGYAQKELIAQTVFADLAAAMWPIGLMKVARVIDNPFSVAKGRAEKAGEVLADALINKAQGERPVTLIGYSLGARVIYTCLKSLAKRKAFGLVESVVLMGSPTPSDTSDWRILRSVVSGRLVNVYSENDYILGFMYRTSAVQYGVAGLQKVEGLAGVENFDVSEDVSAHQKYRFLTGSILKKIGFEDIDMDAVEEEYQTLLKIEEEEKKQSLQAQRDRLLRRQSAGGKEDEAAEAEQEADEMEKQVQDKTQKSLMTRAIEYFYTPTVPNTKDAEKVGKNIQKAVENPSQAKGVVGDTAKDAQASTATYAQWVAKKLPSMPGGGKSSDKAVATGKDVGAKATTAASTTGKNVTNTATSTANSAGKNATEKASGAAASAQSTTKQAAGYFPSMSKNLPSMESISKTLPSMPSMPQRSKQASSKKSSSQPTETAKNVASTTQAGVEGGAAAATDTVKTTVTNLSQPQNNPAVGAVQDTAKNAPAIQQTGEKLGVPGMKKDESYMSRVKKSMPGAKKEEDQSVVSKVAGAVPGTKKEDKRSYVSKVTDSVSGTKQDKDQTYMSKATSYLPNMPSFGSGTTKSGEQKKAPPKLGRTPSSGVQSPKPERKPSGIKSPPPKLDRVPSGIKSPPAKLDRKSSGVKSPPPKLDRVSSGLKKQPMNAANQVSNGVQQGGQKVGQAASGVMSSVPGLGGK